MKAVLEFDLPEDGPEHSYALAGRDALVALDVIDNWARNILKHGDPSEDARAHLEELRANLIPRELTGLLV